MRSLYQISSVLGRSCRALTMTICVVLLLTCHTLSQISQYLPRLSASPSPSSSPQPIYSASTAQTPASNVPLSEVADRLNNLDRLLSKVKERLIDNQNTMPDVNELKDAGKILIEDANKVRAALTEAPTLEQLKEMESTWRTSNSQLKKQNEEVTLKLKELEDDIASLQTEQKFWDLMLTQYQQTIGTDIVVGRINNILSEIKKTLATAQRLRETYLVVQNLIAEQSLTVSDVLDSVTGAEKKYGNQLLIPDRRPLWTVLTSSQAGPSFFTQTRQAMSRELSNAFMLLRKEWLSLLRVSLLFVMVCSVFALIGRKIAQWQA